MINGDLLLTLINVNCYSLAMVLNIFDTIVSKILSKLGLIDLINIECGNIFVVRSN